MITSIPTFTLMGIVHREGHRIVSHGEHTEGFCCGTCQYYDQKTFGDGLPKIGKCNLLRNHTGEHLTTKLYEICDGYKGEEK